MDALSYESVLSYGEAGNLSLPSGCDLIKTGVAAKRRLFDPATCDRIIALCDQLPEWYDGQLQRRPFVHTWLMDTCVGQVVDGLPEFQLGLLSSKTVWNCH